MRVLWFSNSPSNYYVGGSGKGYNGCGWISSLEALMRDRVQLGIVFLTESPCDVPKRVDGVDYFPVFDPSDSRKGRIKKLIAGHGSADKHLVAKYLEIIREYGPDVIQFFGSEHSFGLAAQFTDVPSVLHVQGIMKPYFEVFLPFCSWLRYILFAGGGVSGSLHRLYIRSRWRHAVRREEKVLSNVQIYLCRTEWDKSEILKANPNALVFYGGEVLRPVFYESAGWKPSDGRIVLATTISEPPYKGMDVVLRTGKLLKDSGLDFEWKVFGNVSPAFFEKCTGITCSDAGVTLCGVADAMTLVHELSRCSAYVHPSYIENSPNSVCEAQMAGTPVFAANVGGLPSLIEDGRTGFLFPAGNPAALSQLLLHTLLGSDATRLHEVSCAARKAALSRHNRDKIVEQLLDVYWKLLLASSFAAGFAE